MTRTLRLFQIAAVALPVMTAALLSRWLLVTPPAPPKPPVPKPIIVRAVAAAELERLFDQRAYQWPPKVPVPPLVVEHLPNDLQGLPASQRKGLFFRTLLPLVLLENRRVAEQRAFLNEQFARLPARPSATALERVDAMAQDYRVSGDWRDPAVQKMFLRRVDVVPASLVLAQAANESGWGTSRFARQGNNLFGMWTYKPEQAGMVPQQRAAGAIHRVRVFADLRASVRAYLHHLNVGSAYTELRQRRARLRGEGAMPSGSELAEGLRRYSERGDAYVRDIQAMIRHNGLNRLGTLRLSTTPTAD